VDIFIFIKPVLKLSKHILMHHICSKLLHKGMYALHLCKVIRESDANPLAGPMGYTQFHLTCKNSDSMCSQQANSLYKSQFLCRSKECAHNNRGPFLALGKIWVLFLTIRTVRYLSALWVQTQTKLVDRRSVSPVGLFK
jgi:hypothetical protein